MADMRDTFIQSGDFDDFLEEIGSGDYSQDSFLAIYNHASASEEDNKKYLKLVFNKFAEQAWDQSGHPIENVKVLTKKNLIRFSEDVLANWKKLTPEENDSYI